MERRVFYPADDLYTEVLPDGTDGETLTFDEWGAEIGRANGDAAFTYCLSEERARQTLKAGDLGMACTMPSGFSAARTSGLARAVVEALVFGVAAGGSLSAVRWLIEALSK